MPRSDGAKKKSWCERARIKHPNLVVTTKLDHDLHFLAECTHFPARHWLEIPPEERKQMAASLRPDRMIWGTDAFHMERRPLSISTLDAYFSSPWYSLQLDVKVPEHSGRASPTARSARLGTARTRAGSISSRKWTPTTFPHGARAAEARPRTARCCALPTIGPKVIDNMGVPSPGARTGSAAEP
jgi:hypothetical protein